MLPVEVADRQQPDLVVASYTGPQRGASPRRRPGRYGLLAAHDNQVRILMAVQAEEALARRDGASAELLDYGVRGTLRGAPSLPEQTPVLVQIARVDPLRGWLSFDYLRGAERATQGAP